MIKKIKTIIKDSFYSMDPTRFALVSLCVENNMLLHTLRARVHNGYRKTKRTLLQEFFLLTHNFGPWRIDHAVFKPIISNS